MGDRERDFESKVRPLLPGLGGFLRLRLGEDWEDALQESLLAAWKDWDRFQGTSSLKTWLYAIARHKAADRLRRRGRILSMEGPEEALPSPGFEEGLSQRLSMEAALKGLKPQDRELLYLLYTQGFTQGEAAKLMDLPEGTVKSRLHAIRKQLKEEIR